MIPEVNHVPKSKVSTPTFSIWIPILKSILSLRCTPPKKTDMEPENISILKKKGETSTQPHVFLGFNMLVFGVLGFYRGGP